MPQPWNPRNVASGVTKHFCLNADSSGTPDMMETPITILLWNHLILKTGSHYCHYVYSIRLTSHSQRSCVLNPGVLGLKEHTTQRNFLLNAVPALPVQPSYKCSSSILLNSRYLNTPLLPMFLELPGDHRCLSDCQASLRD